MKYDGTNMAEVMRAHHRWYNEEPGFTEDDRADFSGADLRSKVFLGACLYGANFRGADLRSADLSHCNLKKADFTGAKISTTDFFMSELRGAEIESVPLACPDTGSFVGWKKAYYYSAKDSAPGDCVIVKLRITDDAKRLSATARACRASKVEVLEIQSLDGDVLISDPSSADCAVSMKYIDFEYRVGDLIEVENFEENRWISVASGIHFFINRQDAVDYYDFREARKILKDMSDQYEGGNKDV